ncbi:MAG: DUF1460 domain-containing protein [Muribaculaceae bacterium]|nr:DUF1460 domain-containing protein [Muribaculaceae bacterium]
MTFFRSIICRLLSVALAVSAVATAAAQTEARFGCEATDTTFISELLDRGAAAKPASPEAAVAFYGRSFIGTPYAAHTLEGEPEILTVRVDSLDCTTFVETCMALAYTTMEGRSSWRDFVYNLRRLRYRGGEVDGYPSRLHYICDWAVDNRHRGNFTDATDRFPRYSYVTRTIDFMSRHRDAYPALKDSANYARIRAVESGYSLHRFPYLKTADLNDKEVRRAFRDGDVIALVSNLKDLDVTHMGMVVKDSPTAEPYVLHASQSHGKVEISQQPLADFLRRNRQWIGVRVFRLTN